MSSPFLEWSRQAATDPVDGGSPRLGTPVHRRDQGRPRSARSTESHDAGRHGAARRLGATRRVLGTLRETGRASQRRHGSEPDRRAKEHLGALSLSAVEEPDDINHFKTDSDTPKTWRSTSIHRVLERLRAAINWGMAQTPPLLAKSPFHRFGVRLNKKAESRGIAGSHATRRKRLLDTALQKMNTPEHQYVGKLLHDRIIGALELCCRRGEMLLIQNKRVNWDTCQIGIPGATAKDKENRRIPFNPKGRLAAILKRRRGARSGRVRVRQHERRVPAARCRPAWETLKLLANGHKPKTGSGGSEMEPRSSCDGSICAGTTCGTKARAACSPTAWTSGSFS